MVSAIYLLRHHTKTQILIELTCSLQLNKKEHYCDLFSGKILELLIDYNADFTKINDFSDDDLDTIKYGKIIEKIFSSGVDVGKMLKMCFRSARTYSVY